MEALGVCDSPTIDLYLPAAGAFSPKETFSFSVDLQYNTDVWCKALIFWYCFIYLFILRVGVKEVWGEGRRRGSVLSSTSSIEPNTGVWSQYI